MEFQRKQRVEDEISPKRVLVIVGPRRVGKTTMLTAYVNRLTGKRVLSVTGDDVRVREVLASQDRARILDFAHPYDVIAIDEAQGIPHVGLAAKMLIDTFPEKTIILTGSSSFDLSREVGEPLTGRHFIMTLLPLAQGEMVASHFDLERTLDNFLVFGAYPEVLLAEHREHRVRILRELVSSYLFKDILAFDRIRSSELLMDITRCLAHQVGSEVSLSEIAQTVRTDHKTVARYLDLLEKLFVIKKVRGFSRNLRNEISKKAKYYFLDNGVRNAVIDNFNALALRDDVGKLWENFIFAELYKKSNLDRRLADSFYFWRTHAGQEIDIVRESGGVVTAMEAKWSASAARPPSAWAAAYSEAAFEVIHRENYLEALAPTVGSVDRK